ncbi:hypothetical protein EV208_102291 [Christensenella hongkongensis]|nr:hypothetical protein EV208_102291 [Christensenella hongkongensis]
MKKDMQRKTAPIIIICPYGNSLLNLNIPTDTMSEQEWNLHATMTI